MTTMTELLEYRRRYFSGRGRDTRIAPGVTPAVTRHFSRAIDGLGLEPGARVLELGCGLGRFTELLLQRGFDVTALDLSDELIARLRADLPGAARLTAIAGRAEDLTQLVSGRFDAVVGFFFLHHLPRLEPVLTAARDVLVDGGRLAFCEPNGWNPLVYLQVTLTPGMSWTGEPSIPKMRPAVVFPILRGLGFDDVRTQLYGALPPAISNTSLGGRLERGIEAIAPLRPFSAYRTFSARRSRTSRV